MAQTAPVWRQELFCKSPQRLKELVPFLQAQKLLNINLPNKGKGELASLLERASLLHESLPDAHVCVHYSVNANYHGGPEAGFAALTAFCRQLSELPRCSLLLVSGGGPRKRLDSLRALQLAAGSPEWRSLRLPLAVAFNPYFPDEERRAQERQRLRGKLLAGQGRVRAVYLQAGSDVHRLREGLVFLLRLLDEAEAAGPAGGCQAAAEERQGSAAGPSSPAPKRQRRQQREEEEAQQGEMRVYGSVFVPSRKLLAAMRFRPWGGVFLSEEYLSGVEAADAITVQLLALYAEHGVTPLVETEVETEAQVQRAWQLLRATDASPEPLLALAAAKRLA